MAPGYGVQCSLCRGLLGFVVCDGCLDRLLRQHGAVNLYRRQLQVRGDVAVRDLRRLIDVLPNDHLRRWS